MVVLGGFVEGFGAEGHEVVAVAGGPFLGGFQVGEGVLELGHDVAGDEFVAVADLLAVGPLGGHDEQAAEAAAGLVQPMDGGDQVVGRAHAPGAAVDHGVDELVGRTVEGLLKAHGVFEVVALEASGTDAGLLDGFLAGLGDMNGHDQPPLLGGPWSCRAP